MTRRSGWLAAAPVILAAPIVLASACATVASAHVSAPRRECPAGPPTARNDAGPTARNDAGSTARDDVRPSSLDYMVLASLADSPQLLAMAGYRPAKPPIDEQQPGGGPL